MSLDELAADARPLLLFVSAFFLSGFGGLTWLLRATDRPFTRRTAWSAFFNSAFLGMVVSMLWFAYYKSNVVFLLGLCCAVGLGGTPMVNFMDWCFQKLITRYLQTKFGVDLSAKETEKKQCESKEESSG